jgi:SAM-dependent methyltransferase
MMKYLARQHALAKQAIREGIPLEDVLAIKFYIQTLLSETVMELVPRGASILEVGCGGSLAIHLIERHGYRCFAVDHDPSSLQFSALLRTYLATSVALAEADAFRLPFRDDSFDYVYSVGMIEHYERSDQEALVAEMRRCATRFIHLEVPNVCETSAFYPLLVADDDECHLPCDISELLKTAGMRPIHYDGRCVFPRRALVEANPALRRFVDNVPGYVAKKAYRIDDIETLCALERGLDRSDRLRFGYQVYGIGALYSSP